MWPTSPHNNVPHKKNNFCDASRLNESAESLGDKMDEKLEALYHL